MEKSELVSKEFLPFRSLAQRLAFDYTEVDEELDAAFGEMLTGEASAWLDAAR